MKKYFTLLFLSLCLIVKGQNCIPNSSSLSFDGIASYVEFPAASAFEISNAITIEAWINSNYWGFTSAQNTILCKHGWYFGEGGYVLRAGGTGELSFNIAGNDGVVGWREVVSPLNSLQLNTWYHVACTFDGSEMKLYINGVASGSTSFVGTIQNYTDYHVKIGKLSDDNQWETRYWSGMMDEIRLWNRALTQSEIMANMGNHIDVLTATGLVGYWRMNDQTGSTITDLGTSGTSGTLMNAIWSTAVPFTEGPPVPTITPGGPYLYSSSPVNNQWNLNGVPIPGADFLSYVPTQNGSYTVTVTDSNGCSVTSLPHDVTTLGINNITLKELIRIQKVTNEKLLFISSPELLRKSEIKLSDINGRMVSVKAKGTFEDSMDISRLSKGVYLVWISLERASYNSKIIVD